jgi:lipopolysaccharide biosynthesis regulator YciM
MKFFNKLFCKHDYEYLLSHLINDGMQKLVEYKCNKCGNVETRIV